MAQSALRNLPLERMNARRARVGMEPFVPQAPTKTAGQAMADMLGGMSIPLSFVPVAGDVAGLAADAAMYAAYPEERTLGNAAMTLAGVLPFVPAASTVRAGEKAINIGADIKNTGSIPATLENYEIVKGIQTLPITAFESRNMYDLFYAKDDMDRVRSLAGQIRKNNRIDPLIVVQDSKGYYVLEGAHRLGALDAIGAEEVPAMIVKDLDDPYVPELSNPTNLGSANLTAGIMGGAVGLSALRQINQNQQQE